MAGPLVKLNLPSLSYKFIRKTGLGFCSIVLAIASLLDLLYFILAFFIVIPAAKEKSAGRNYLFFTSPCLQSWHLLTYARISKSWSLKDGVSLYLASCSSELSVLLVWMDDDGTCGYVFILVELYGPKEVLFLGEEDVEFKFGNALEEKGF